MCKKRGYLEIVSSDSQVHSPGPGRVANAPPEADRTFPPSTKTLLSLLELKWRAPIPAEYQGKAYEEGESTSVAVGPKFRTRRSVGWL